MDYRILALDMDGTVLDSNRQIPPRTAQAIHKALAAGVHVLFATGRCKDEMDCYLKDFPDMKYVMLQAGATVYDLEEKRYLFTRAVPEETVHQIEAIGKKYDAAVSYYIGDHVIVWDHLLENMAYYNLEYYESVYKGIAIVEHRSGEYFLQDPKRAFKVNLHFHSYDEWVIGGEELKKLGVNFATTLPCDYEISNGKVDKGACLRKLCEVLDVPIGQTIAVGDSENDTAMIVAAGLGIAMGTSPQSVLDAADVVVGDSDHDAVADVIERYFGVTV